ncbi:long-chain-fatty-acid--CoA ligase [Photobacterium proteolyticum]|uniref:Long-chain-fatty-acid--CoA ligase n=1 Tax=Photobacterium proteolyticum TaxID=1903952 RepID=A0A1Q9GV90_9GAMM|nr:long-chain fatty acid--CoA ligase [Photobacterium proteolyticum]OLQ79081.1 long-chain-fatty-acid--CoA ligase [Photobacterium proteolyticum]
MMSLAAALQRNASCKPDKVAIICGDTHITYAEFDVLASKVANGLIAKGVLPGDKVALSCPNLPFFPIIYYGIQKAGAVVVPLNVLLKEREIKYHLEDSRAKFFFCFEGTDVLPMGEAGIAAFNQVDHCLDMVVMTADQNQHSFNGQPSFSAFIKECDPQCDYLPRRADDTAVILYTSGTTGLPKGAELTQGNMVCNALVSENLMAAQADDVQLVTLPLFHSFGQTVNMNASVFAGATMVLVPRFEPATVLEMIAEHKVTVFAGVPTMYIALNHCPNELDVSSLRLAISGGSSMPKEVIHVFEERFNVPILEGYGLSETSPVACFNHLDQERIPGSVGQPIQGVEIRLADVKGEPVACGEEGEVIIRGHNIMKGYLNRPEENENAIRDGWFFTGDIGRFDEKGNLYIVDRVKDLIIRGGFNVYPREIEEVFMTHPAVAMVAVIGIPDQEYGEEIKAYVVLKDGADADEQVLYEWGKAQFATFKYPRSVEIRQQLPMSATGKILKKDLKAEVRMMQSAK